MGIREELLEKQLRPERTLLANLKQQLPQLEAMQTKVSGHWTYEDGLYRFFYQSFKVYDLQPLTLEMAALLTSLAPRPNETSDYFQEIIAKGTNLTFTMDVNERWLETTTPIVTAFLCCKYFIEMAVKYAPLVEPPQPMPSGYAALLCLYKLR